MSAMIFIFLSILILLSSDKVMQLPSAFQLNIRFGKKSSMKISSLYVIFVCLIHLNNYGHLQSRLSHLLERDHLISMVSKLHRERQDCICYCFAENAHAELALEFRIKFSLFHFFGADPGVLFLFLGHHLHVVKIEGVQAADDLAAVSDVSDGSAGGGLVDCHFAYAGSV